MHGTLDNHIGTLDDIDAAIAVLQKLRERVMIATVTAMRADAAQWPTTLPDTRPEWDK